MKRRPIYTLAYLHTPWIFYSSLFWQRNTSWMQKRSEKQNHCRVWSLFKRYILWKKCVFSMVFCYIFWSWYFKSPRITSWQQKCAKDEYECNTDLQVKVGKNLVSTYLVLGICNLTPGNWHLTPSTLHLALDTWNLTPGTWHLEPAHLKPGTWRLKHETCAPGTCVLNLSAFA